MYCIICNKSKYPIFLFNKNNYCINHSKIYYNKQITIIQKIFRGYKIRKYLKAIYYKLPRDLQIYILNLNHNFKNYCLIRKYITSITYKINSFQNIQNHSITLYELDIILKKIIKNYPIIEYNWINYYKFYFDNIYYIILKLLNENYIDTNSNIIQMIYNSIDLYPNLINNDFNEIAKIILNKINLFNNSFSYNNSFLYNK